MRRPPATPAGRPGSSAPPVGPVQGPGGPGPAPEPPIGRAPAPPRGQPPAPPSLGAFGALGALGLPAAGSEGGRRSSAHGAEPRLGPPAGSGAGRSGGRPGAAGRGARGGEERGGRRAERPGVRRLVVVLTTSIFAADLILPPGLSTSGLYIVPVLLGLWGASRRTTLLVASACTALTALGLVLPLVAGERWPFGTPVGVAGPERSREVVYGLVEGVVAVFAIWVTARLGLMRRGIEDELRRSREVNATTLASIADAVIATDRHGRIGFLNESAAALTGWSSEEAAGRRLGEVFRRADRGSDDRPLAPVEELAAVEGEALLLTRDGKRVPVETSTAPIREAEIPGGEPLGSVLVFRDITARKQEQERVQELAYRDGLTGLANRVSFLDRLRLELAHARRRDAPLALLYMDLDGFKEVNDSHGHAIGDALLVEVGRRLTSALRAADTVARLGGDEFTVILPEVGAAARGVAEKLLERLTAPYRIEGLELCAPPSIGVALFPRDGDDVDALLRHADRAMYAAKNAGGARIAGLEPGEHAPRILP